jgi:hypothetical protein
MIDFIRGTLVQSGTVGPGDPEIITVTDDPEVMETMVRKALYANRLAIAGRPRRIRLLAEG